MNKKAVEWLYEQLPELVEKEIIPTASVALIRKYYGAVDNKHGGRTIFTLFGIIGAMLVGLGIILILAHNWDQLSRITRVLITVGMLVIAQMLVAFTIWSKRDNIVWAESSSTFLMLTIGASIALIGQTYHLADDFSSFLLTWMLLSIPLVYLMGVTAPTVLYLVGITAWVMSGDFGGMGKQLIWVLLALVGPYYWKLLKRNPSANTTVIISWVLILCVYISFGSAFKANLHHLYMLMYATLFALTYFVGIICFNSSIKAWQKPFKTIGLTGCVGISFLLTFRDLWQSIGRGFYAIVRSEYLLALILLALTVMLGSRVINKNNYKNYLWSATPVVVGVGFFLMYLDTSGMNATVLLNAYMLFWGVTIIRKGAQEGSLGTLNRGMLLVATLIIMRFFDINFSFVARGVVFVILGCCFLAANWVMVRRKKEVTK